MLQIHIECHQRDERHTAYLADAKRDSTVRCTRTCNRKHQRWDWRNEQTYARRSRSLHHPKASPNYRTIWYQFYRRADKIVEVFVQFLPLTCNRLLRTQSMRGRFHQNFHWNASSSWSSREYLGKISALQKLFFTLNNLFLVPAIGETNSSAVMPTITLTLAKFPSRYIVSGCSVRNLSWPKSGSITGRQVMMGQL